MTRRVQRGPFPVIARSTCDEAIQFFLRGQLDCFAPLAMTRRVRRRRFPVIARSNCDEAIQRLLRGLLDCFASLAMTRRVQRKPFPVIASLAPSFGRPAWMKHAL